MRLGAGWVWGSVKAAYRQVQFRRQVELTVEHKRLVASRTSSPASGTSTTHMKDVYIVTVTNSRRRGTSSSRGSGSTRRRMSTSRVPSYPAALRPKSRGAERYEPIPFPVRPRKCSVSVGVSSRPTTRSSSPAPPGASLAAGPRPRVGSRRRPADALRDHQHSPSAVVVVAIG